MKATLGRKKRPWVGKSDRGQLQCERERERPEKLRPPCESRAGILSSQGKEAPTRNEVPLEHAWYDLGCPPRREKGGE